MSKISGGATRRVLGGRSADYARHHARTRGGTNAPDWSVASSAVVHAVLTEELGRTQRGVEGARGELERMFTSVHELHTFMARCKSRLSKSDYALTWSILSYHPCREGR